MRNKKNIFETSNIAYKRHKLRQMEYESIQVNCNAQSKYSHHLFRLAKSIVNP